MKDLWLPILIVLGIIVLGLTGGLKVSQQTTQTNSENYWSTSTQPVIPPPSERQMSTEEISSNLQTAQYQTQQLQQQVAAEEAAKLASQYTNQITMNWGSYGTTNPDQEYITLQANYNNTAPIDITGWTLVSTSTNQTVTIPQSTALYFSNSLNSVEDVRLSPGEYAYIITGKSPISYGFHVNICTGYLTQSSTFTPGLYTSCPAPRDEDLKSIPLTPNNNNCFDLINSLPSCRSGPTLDNSYSYECQQFVENKLNYQSCVDTHKNDPNFYSPKEWYVYLGRGQSLWQPQRETVILYDNLGKPVAKMSR